MELVQVDDYFVGRFSAMASPCEVLVDTADRKHARRALEIADGEARRIEHKWSRYRGDGVVHRINHARGRAVRLDDETAQLVGYADTCFALSDGLFDITSGALRRVWTFDGGDRVPPQHAIDEVLAHVGWQRVRWEPPRLTLPEGMEIDLGGLGKEYAVDRAVELVTAAIPEPVLVNFGGDLRASGPRRSGHPWRIGLDDPDRPGDAVVQRLELARGGLATSGNARRYLVHQGKRLGHILNPRTGWPVADAPRSVTVIADTCIEAGTLATLAYLRGPGAREFLEAQRVAFRLL